MRKDEIMKAVMLSINPKWCELIASGKKTVEVRKTKPKLKTPFKCYIYCTKDKSIQLFVDEIQKDEAIPHIANGKVIGEFVCDNIELLDIEQTNCLSKACKNICALKNNSCLSSYDLLTYLQVKNGYAWHISDLMIYDKPKELSEFGLKRPPQSWSYEEELSI